MPPGKNVYQSKSSIVQKISDNIVEYCTTKALEGIYGGGRVAVVDDQTPLEISFTPRAPSSTRRINSDRSFVSTRFTDCHNIRQYNRTNNNRLPVN